MEDQSPSSTALVTARMRTIHTVSDPQPIINDPWGSKLAMASTLAAIKSGVEVPSGNESEMEELVDDMLRSSPAYANVIARSCYSEDALLSAISGGVNQYVLIGAGYDSYALRRPPEAQRLEIFEIDHPSTQAMKKQRLAECGVPDGGGVHFIAADLGQESVASALTRSTFQPTERAFLSWLGVTMYLTREANMATLGSVAQCCAPGTELVFSYVDQRIFESGSTSATAEHFARLGREVENYGEPFVSGFDPFTLANDLRDVGLNLEEDLDDRQVLQRFDPSDANGLRSASISRIARVRVI